jgi:uncharacterized protein with FMN-binding domain
MTQLASAAFRKRAALVTIAGIGLAGALAGCSTAASTDSGSDSGSTSTKATTPATSTGTTTTSTSGTYKDGSYTKNGTYSSPGGNEVISVELTLKSNVVTAVTVKTVKADPTATGYENMFIAGIGKVVVGKKLDDINVSRVAGSSLTSQGFNSAVTEIKAAAKA